MQNGTSSADDHTSAVTCNLTWTIPCAYLKLERVPLWSRKTLLCVGLLLSEMF